MNSDHSTRIVEFVTAVTTAMGLTLQAAVTETPELLRVNLSGDGAEWLVRRRGETLNALQHIVATVFRDSAPEEQRIVVDCLGFRQDKDAELRNMALFMAGKAVDTGAPRPIANLKQDRCHPGRRRTGPPNHRTRIREPRHRGVRGQRSAALAQCRHGAEAHAGPVSA